MFVDDCARISFLTEMNYVSVEIFVWVHHVTQEQPVVFAFTLSCYYNWQATKSRPQDCEDANNVLTAMRSCFGHTALDYVFQVHVWFNSRRESYDLLSVKCEFSKLAYAIVVLHVCKSAKFRCTWNSKIKCHGLQIFNLKVQILLYIKTSGTQYA